MGGESVNLKSPPWKFHCFIFVVCVCMGGRGVVCGKSFFHIWLGGGWFYWASGKKILLLIQMLCIIDNLRLISPQCMLWLTSTEAQGQGELVGSSWTNPLQPKQFPGFFKNSRQYRQQPSKPHTKLWVECCLKERKKDELLQDVTEVSAVKVQFGGRGGGWFDEVKSEVHKKILSSKCKWGGGREVDIW